MAAIIVLFWFGSWVAAIWLSQHIATGKGRSNGWVWGVLLGWIGVLICALRSPVNQVASLSPAEQEVRELEAKVRIRELNKQLAE